MLQSPACRRWQKTSAASRYRHILFLLSWCAFKLGAVQEPIRWCRIPQHLLCSSCHYCTLSFSLLMSILQRKQTATFRSLLTLCAASSVRMLSTGNVRPHALPADKCSIMQRLRQAEWFTARVSVCGLFAAAYPKASSEQQEQLRTLFKELSRDETPMVRRAAATHIGTYAGALPAADVQTSLVPLLCVLLGDDQESVRKLALESAPPLVTALQGNDGGSAVLDACADTVLKDGSWRVRHGVTTQLPVLAAAYEKQRPGERLIKAFVSMLSVRLWQAGMRGGSVILYCCCAVLLFDACVAACQGCAVCCIVCTLHSHHVVARVRCGGIALAKWPAGRRVMDHT